MSKKFIALSLVFAAFAAGFATVATDRRDFKDLAMRTAIADEAAKPGSRCPLSRAYIDHLDLDLVSICLTYGLSALDAAQRYPHLAPRVFSLYGDDATFRSAFDRYGQTALAEAFQLLTENESKQHDGDYRDDFGAYWLTWANRANLGVKILPGSGGAHKTTLARAVRTDNQVFVFPGKVDAARFWTNLTGAAPLRLKTTAVISIDPLPVPARYPDSAEDLWALVQSRSEGGTDLLAQLMANDPMEAFGHAKAEALASTIRADLPMISFVQGYRMTFATFARRHLEALRQADLIVSCTGNWAADASVEYALMQLGDKASAVYGWMEAHALAAHAVLIGNSDAKLSDGFDEYGEFRLPAVAGGKPSPPECGGASTPFGAIELSNGQALVARLAVDAVRGIATGPVWRSWLSDFAAFQEAEATVAADWLARRGQPGEMGGFFNAEWVFP